MSWVCASALASAIQDVDTAKAAVNALTPTIVVNDAVTRLNARMLDMANALVLTNTSLLRVENDACLIQQCVGRPLLQFNLDVVRADFQLVSNVSCLCCQRVC